MSILHRARPGRARLILPAILLVLGFPGALRADFSVFRAPSHILSLFVLPGETAPFDLATYAGVPTRDLGRFDVASDRVRVDLDKSGRFMLTPPAEVGIYPVRFQERAARNLDRPAPYQVQVVVMRSSADVRDGMLNGYPVGHFPEDHMNEHWRFQRPRGFVEITEANRDTKLSDHFTLGELDCKLEAPYPHYAAVQTGLLVKLEGLCDALLSRGLPGDHMKILSGFRTPEYNRAIGNRTTYSRHIAGDAADVYVDRDGNDRMDDLNGDGRINRRDSRYLLALVNQMDQSVGYGALVGGASAYRANREHGPFLHVDTRGYPARW